MQPLRSRQGTTLIEQLIAITLLGILLAVAVRSGIGLLDKAAARAAAREASDAFAAARDHAVAYGVRTAVHINTVEDRVVIHALTDTIARLFPGKTYHVQLEASRDSMAYAPSGLGWGASNLRLVMKRGAAAETLTVSRLGRVRRD